MAKVKMINIVMPVYNRPIHTQQAIKSLYENTHYIFDLTIVDDCSEPETQTLLEKLKNKHGFKLLRNKMNVGPGESRNIACRSIKKRQKFLYFSDNDVFFKYHWDETLDQLWHQGQKFNIRLLGGSCHPYLQPNKTIDLGLFKLKIRDAISGYSHLITWEIWDKFGPFETQFGLQKKTGRSDDWAFCQKIRQAGFEVASIEPEVIVPTGKTDSYGSEAVGVDTFENHQGVKVL